MLDEQRKLDYKKRQEQKEKSKKFRKMYGPHRYQFPGFRKKKKV